MYDTVPASNERQLTSINSTQPPLCCCCLAARLLYSSSVTTLSSRLKHSSSAVFLFYRLCTVPLHYELFTNTARSSLFTLVAPTLDHPHDNNVSNSRRTVTSRINCRTANQLPLSNPPQLFLSSSATSNSCPPCVPSSSSYCCSHWRCPLQPAVASQLSPPPRHSPVRHCHPSSRHCQKRHCPPNN